MKETNFKRDLVFSELNFAERKKLYETELGLKNILFHQYDTEENKRLQHRDVDVTGEDTQGNKCRISEKIRRYDFPGDVLVEMWSGFEERIKGWLSDSIADFLVLFYHDKVICVNVPELKIFCKKFFDNFTVKILNKEFSCLIEQDKRGKRLAIGGTTVFLTVSKNRRKNGRIYHTVSVCFPEEYLIENHVKIKEI